MSTNDYRKCAKCGKTRAEDMLVSYHRFPNPGKNNLTKAHAWAKYCWPDKDWAHASLLTLNMTNKVLCGRHFAMSQFYDNKRQKLSKFAVPDLPEIEELLNERDNVFKQYEDDSLPDHNVIEQAGSLGQRSKRFLPRIVDNKSGEECKSKSSQGRVVRNLHVNTDGDNDNRSDDAGDTSIIDTDVIENTVDDEVPILKESEEGPFTWQKEAIMCGDDEDHNVVEKVKATHKDAQEEQPTIVMECEEVEQVHGGYRCDECAGDIVGCRYVCVQCAEYDVCAACEARGKHKHHYALRVPPHKHTDEIQRVIEAIRKCINHTSYLTLPPTDEIVKIEIKDENVEHPNETEYEDDPLMVPSVPLAEESSRRVPEQQRDPFCSSSAAHGEHTEHAVRDEHTEHAVHNEHTEHTEYKCTRTLRDILSAKIHNLPINQQFILNASRKSDTDHSNKLEGTHHQSKTQAMKPHVILRKPIIIKKTDLHNFKLKKFSINLNKLENVGHLGYKLLIENKQKL